MEKKKTAKIKTVDIVSLGCSKNLVDSEKLMAQLSAGGIHVTHDDPDPKGEVVVINTCGFINDAKEESIDMILQFAEAKKRGEIKRLYVMGCLSQRYFDQLGESIPEVDKYYGKFNWTELVTEIGATYRRDLMNERTLTTPSHYAYLKVAEGCNRHCSYCAIPIITGPFQSRPIDEIVDEARQLRDKGVRELQVIAQDLSYYGVDMYKKSRLAELTHKLTEIEGIDWVRLHYAYPAGFPLDLLTEMAQNPKVCNYLDLALQHISDHMLTKMRRNITKQQTMDLLAKIRETVPGINLRTTLIAGHPGETEEDFAELMQFVKDARFERLGVFPYSHEQDTYSWKNYKDDVPDEVKVARAEQIMELQSGISADINSQKVGRTYKVMIDRTEGDTYIGRTEYDSPEVDPEVVVFADQELKIGEFYNVKITQAEEYDLIGEVAE